MRCLFRTFCSAVESGFGSKKTDLHKLTNNNFGSYNATKHYRQLQRSDMEGTGMHQCLFSCLAVEDSSAQLILFYRGLSARQLSTHVDHVDRCCAKLIISHGHCRAALPCTLPCLGLHTFARQTSTNARSPKCVAVGGQASCQAHEPSSLVARCLFVADV